MSHKSCCGHLDGWADGNGWERSEIRLCLPRCSQRHWPELRIGLDRISSYVGQGGLFFWDEAVAYNHSINGICFSTLSDDQWETLRQLFDERNGVPI